MVRKKMDTHKNEVETGKHVVWHFGMYPEAKAPVEDKKGRLRNMGGNKTTCNEAYQPSPPGLHFSDIHEV